MEIKDEVSSTKPSSRPVETIFGFRWNNIHETCVGGGEQQKGFDSSAHLKNLFFFFCSFSH